MARTWPGADLVEHPGQLTGLGPPEHAQTVLVLGPLLARVVVDVAHWPQAQGGVAHELAYHQMAALPGADDEHLPGTLDRADRADPALPRQVDAKAHPDQQHDHDEQEQGDHRQRQLHPRGDPVGRRGLDGAEHVNAADDEQRADHGSLDDRLVVALGDVVPHPLVGAEAHERGQDQRHHPPEGGAEQMAVAGVLAVQIPVEAELEGDEVTEGDQHPVRDDLNH